MCNTCSVISSLRDLKQTCWQTGNMNFQNGTNCALQKLLTAVLLPLLRNCGHFYRCNMRFLKASLAQNCHFQWLECFPYAGVEKLFSFLWKCFLLSPSNTMKWVPTPEGVKEGRPLVPPLPSWTEDVECSFRKWLPQKNPRFL